MAEPPRQAGAIKRSSGQSRRPIPAVRFLIPKELRPYFVTHQSLGPLTLKAPLHYDLQFSSSSIWCQNQISSLPHRETLKFASTIPSATATKSLRHHRRFRALPSATATSSFEFCFHVTTSSRLTPMFLFFSVLFYFNNNIFLTLIN